MAKISLPVLIVHGWNTTADVQRYNPLKKELENRGYPVFIPDLPGFYSRRNLSKPLQLDDYAHFVEKYICQKVKKEKGNKKNKLILIGHSFGGRIGIKLAAKNPGLIKILVLTGTPGFVPTSRAKILFFFILAKAGRAALSVPVISVARNPVRKMLYRLAKASDYLHLNGFLKQTFKNIIREDLERPMRQIKIPCLLIWGSEDKLIPLGIAKKMQTTIHGSKLEIIPKGNHIVVWKQPKKFVDKVEKFLQTLQ